MVAPQSENDNHLQFLRGNCGKGQAGNERASPISFFLSLFFFIATCVVGTVNRWQADASCRESSERRKKKRNAKVTTNNTGNNGTIITSRPVNSAYDLPIPPSDYNRNNRNLAQVASCSRPKQPEVSRGKYQL